MDTKAVKIFTAQDNMQAQMIMNTLKDNNIPAYKKDLGDAGLMNIYSGNSRSGEEIYVAETDVDRTKEVLMGMGVWEEER